MISNCVLVIIVAIAVSKSYFVRGEYYWQNYTGVVPDDAIEGGYDENGNSVYIAQAEVKGQAILVTTLYPKVPYVTVSTDNTVTKVESNIKILCGSELPVDWLQASAETLHVVLIGKNPVRGGHYRNSSLHVGRVFYENGIRIGSVLSFNLDTADLIFVHNDGVWRTKTYEVLLYGTARVNRRRPAHRVVVNRSRFN